MGYRMRTLSKVLAVILLLRAIKSPSIDKMTTLLTTRVAEDLKMRQNNNRFRCKFQLYRDRLSRGMAIKTTTPLLLWTMSNKTHPLRSRNDQRLNRTIMATMPSIELSRTRLRTQLQCLRTSQTSVTSLIATLGSTDQISNR